VGFSSPADFPVSLVPSKKYGVLYMVTRSGYLYLFDLPTVPMTPSHWSRACLLAPNHTPTLHPPPLP